MQWWLLGDKRGGMKGCCSKDMKLQLNRWVSSRNLLYNIVPLVSMRGILPGWLSSKESACNAGGRQEMQVQFLGWGDPLEKEMATHFSILARKMAWTEEPGGLRSMRLQRVRHSYTHVHIHS